jgi:hypothetical protein
MLSRAAMRMPCNETSRMSLLRCIWLAAILMLIGSNESRASDFNRLPRIGWVYRIEGQIEGQPVLYIGSAADLKQRLNASHKWGQLLRDGGTKVHALEVFAKLDVPASNRGTALSARTEALRAAEQRALDQVRAQVEATNRNMTPGQKETKILNEINASADTGAWEARHKVSTSKSWHPIEKRITRATPRTLATLTLLDVYLMYRDMKVSQYVMSPYVLGDEHGNFMLEQRHSLLSSQHFKVYLDGNAKGQKIEISSSEFTALKEEAEALWGTVDWNGDFVPGLMNRELPLLVGQEASQMN